MLVTKDSGGKQKPDKEPHILYAAHDNKRNISAVVRGQPGARKPEKVYVWYLPKKGESKRDRENLCWWALFQRFQGKLLKAVKYL